MLLAMTSCFSVVFTTDAPHQYWKIIPHDNLSGDLWANGVLGTAIDGDASESGSLVSDNPKAGMIEEPGLYRMTLDMSMRTYTVKKLVFNDFLYEIGGESGWTDYHKLRKKSKDDVMNDGRYQGYYYLTSEFRFTPNNDNSEDAYGCIGAGKISDNGGSDCPAPDADFYQIDVDLVRGTYALTAVQSITMVGDHNGWNQKDANCHMIYNATENCWEIEQTFEGTASLKFAMNDDWTVSWGGANEDPLNYENLTQNNGANLAVPGAGTYLVKLYLSCEGGNRVTFTQRQ